MEDLSLIKEINLDNLELELLVPIRNKEELIVFRKTLIEKIKNLKTTDPIYISYFIVRDNLRVKPTYKDY